MNPMRSLMALPFLALPLAAQVQLEGNLSLMFATQDMNKMVAPNSILGAHTTSLAGTALGGAIRLPVSETFSHRFHLNLLGFKGNPGSGLENARPRHWYGGYEACQRVGGAWTVFGGMFAIDWNEDADRVTDPNYGDISRLSGNPLLFPATSNTNNSPKGLKLGARFGVERSFGKSWSVHATFHQSEFNKIYTPSWILLGFTYRMTPKAP